MFRGKTLNLVSRPHDDFFQFEIPSAEFYPDGTGHTNFYGTRKTDGGRPALYTKLLEGALQIVDLIIGIGCGDSAVEASLLSRFGTVGSRYFAVDISDAMLRATEERLHGMGEGLRLFRADFSLPETVDLITSEAKELGPSSVLTTILGRTFGNHPISTWLGTCIRLTDLGSVLIDYYSMRNSEEEAIFRRRMTEVCAESKSFFVHPLEISGIPPDEIDLKLQFEESALGLCANFYVVLDEAVGPILLHQIRCIRSDALFKELEIAARINGSEFPILGQLAPMSLALLSRSL